MTCQDFEEKNDEIVGNGDEKYICMCCVGLKMPATKNTMQVDLPSFENNSLAKAPVY